MKITKFAQSCILIETHGKRILLDPGSFQYKESYPNNEWKDIDILLVTHKHGDHCHVDAIREVVKNSKTKFYSTEEVVKAYPEFSPEIVKENDILTFDSIKIEVVRAVHGYIPLLKGGKEIYENVGFIIDDCNKRVYQTSDTICFENNYKCDILFVPVVNHGLVMSSWEAALFAKETGAGLVIPIHYDNPSHPADFQQLKRDFKELNLNLKLLKIKETIEV